MIICMCGLWQILDVYDYMHVCLLAVSWCLWLYTCVASGLSCWTLLFVFLYWFVGPHSRLVLFMLSSIFCIHFLLEGLHVSDCWWSHQPNPLSFRLFRPEIKEETTVVKLLLAMKIDESVMHFYKNDWKSEEKRAESKICKWRTYNTLIFRQEPFFQGSHTKKNKTHNK